MKGRIFIMLALCAFLLGACACPRPSVYQGVPYEDEAEDERTAGDGLNEEGCLRRALS